MSTPEERDYRGPVSEMDRIKAGLALHMVAARVGAPIEAMTARGRAGASVSRARWTAMYLTHTAYGWTLERVAHAFVVNRATVGKACRWVEDRRDQADFDAMLEEVEGQLTAIFSAPRLELAA